MAMQEIEQLVNSPQIQFLLENREITGAGAVIGLATAYAVGGQIGEWRGEKEIDSLNQEFENEELYEEAMGERKEELSQKISEESSIREIYNHFRHAYTSGKLSAFEEEQTRIENTGKNTYLNQKFADEDLEYLD